MLGSLKKSWQELKQGRPGHRFQERAKKGKRERLSQSWIKRFLKPVIAIILIAGGVVLCVIPGPGMPLVVAGAALLAERSLTIARSLDWIEVRVRKVMSSGKAWWRHATGTARFAAMFIGAVVIGGAGYGGYLITFGH